MANRDLVVSASLSGSEADKAPAATTVPQVSPLPEKGSYGDIGLGDVGSAAPSASVKPLTQDDDLGDILSNPAFSTDVTEAPASAADADAGEDFAGVLKDPAFSAELIEAPASESGAVEDVVLDDPSFSPDLTEAPGAPEADVTEEVPLIEDANGYLVPDTAAIEATASQERHKIGKENEEEEANAAEAPVKPLPADEQKVDVRERPRVNENVRKDTVTLEGRDGSEKVSVSQPKDEPVVGKEKIVRDFALQFPTLASNLQDNPSNLTVSALEACPADATYEARIIVPGKQAILFAVTPDGVKLPVMTLNANLAEERFSGLFLNQDSLDRIIYEVTKSDGFRPKAKDFAALGGRDIRFSIPTSEALHNRIDEGINNVTASRQREDEEFVKDLEHSLEIAVTECIKRIREDVPNAVRDQLVHRLKGIGIQDAASIVDNVFHEQGLNFANDLIKRTRVLASKPVEVRNEAAENATHANFKKDADSAPASRTSDVPEHSVAASLEQGSSPLRGTVPAGSHANPAGQSAFMDKFGPLLGYGK